MRERIIAGNWKMNKTVPEALELIETIKYELSRDDYKIVVCPPFTALYSVGGAVSGTPIALGAQNVFWEDRGAFTGEISPVMLADLGVEFVIVGHSERRRYFGETDEMINRKVRAVLAHKMRPILCVGETLEQREAGKTIDVVTHQLREALKGVSESEAKRLVIAYEPVWAIGTGRTATPLQAQAAHAFIREELNLMFGKEVGDQIPILYGGSVKPDNVADLTGMPDVDGALVGGASLKAESFIGIIENAQ
ncbi:MAG: triose-phosphate isomerase [Candidatus Hydrothermota bacterium]|nr:MAG: triose-phosphate isomerase [Candidatus Hydrothermae bacterium]